MGRLLADHMRSLAPGKAGAGAALLQGVESATAGLQFRFADIGGSSGCSRKKRIISAVASGPCGSV